MPGHIHDDELGHVMTLGPMYKTDDAVAFITRLGIPDMTARVLTGARKAGEIPCSVFGRSIVFTERDILVWIASRYGRGNEHYTVRGQAIKAAKDAAKIPDRRKGKPRSSTAPLARRDRGKAPNRK